MKAAGLLSGACIALVLGGCSNAPPREYATVMIGSGTSPGASLVGPLAGPAVGSVAARAMVESDRRRAARALDSAPDGQPSTWRNSETGVGFVLTPTRTFELRGVKCRDYTVDAVVGGRPDTVGGSACRQADGHWHAMG